jgi:hypothetical protein
VGENDGEGDGIVGGDRDVDDEGMYVALSRWVATSPAIPYACTFFPTLRSPAPARRGTVKSSVHVAFKGAIGRSQQF